MCQNNKVDEERSSMSQIANVPQKQAHGISK
jgi:hypothetical protein